MSDPSTVAGQTRNRTVLLTGTSSGIGLASAVAAARAGWTTVATMRDPDRSDRLRAACDEAGVSVDVRRLDVTDPDSVARCLAEVDDRHGGLDALVNNAGAGLVGTVENQDLADIRDCLEVNFFGVVQVTRAALPLLRASGGRCVTVTSVGGVIGQPFNEAYCSAKFAVEGFMESLAPTAAALGVRVSVVEPGAVASEFVNTAGVDPAAMIAAAGPYGPVLERYLDRTLKQFGNAAQPADEVAEVIVQLLQQAQPPFRVQTSDGARQFVSAKLSDLDGSVVQGVTSSWIA